MPPGFGLPSNVSHTSIIRPPAPAPVPTPAPTPVAQPMPAPGLPTGVTPGQVALPQGPEMPDTQVTQETKRPEPEPEPEPLVVAEIEAEISEVEEEVEDVDDDLDSLHDKIDELQAFLEDAKDELHGLMDEETDVVGEFVSVAKGLANGTGSPRRSPPGSPLGFDDEFELPPRVESDGNDASDFDDDIDDDIDDGGRLPAIPEGDELGEGPSDVSVSDSDAGGDSGGDIRDMIESAEAVVDNIHERLTDLDGEPMDKHDHDVTEEAEEEFGKLVEAVNAVKKMDRKRRGTEEGTEIEAKILKAVVETGKATEEDLNDVKERVENDKVTEETVTSEEVGDTEGVDVTEEVETTEEGARPLWRRQERLNHPDPDEDQEVYRLGKRGRGHVPFRPLQRRKFDDDSDDDIDDSDALKKDALEKLEVLEGDLEEKRKQQKLKKLEIRGVERQLKRAHQRTAAYQTRKAILEKRIKKLEEQKAIEEGL